MNFLLEVPRQKIWNNLCENTEETLIELRNNLETTDGNVNKLIEQISLEGSTIATEKLAECQDFVTEAINESLDDTQDPFQDSTRRKSLSDPFM